MRFRLLEVAGEGDRARVPDGLQGGFLEVGPGLDVAQLRRLDQRVGARDPRGAWRRRWPLGRRCRYLHQLWSSLVRVGHLQMAIDMPAPGLAICEIATCPSVLAIFPKPAPGGFVQHSVTFLLPRARYLNSSLNRCGRGGTLPEVDRPEVVVRVGSGVLPPVQPVLHLPAGRLLQLLGMSLSPCEMAGTQRYQRLSRMERRSASTLSLRALLLGALLQARSIREAHALRGARCLSRWVPGSGLRLRPRGGGVREPFDPVLLRELAALLDGQNCDPLAASSPANR